MKKSIYSILVLSLFIVLISGCKRNGSFSRMNYTEEISEDGFSFSYELFNGETDYEIHVEEPLELTVNVVTEEGTLDLMITEKNGTEYRCPYKGNDLDTAYFKVGLPEAGDYIVHLKANHHRGSIKVMHDNGNT